MVDRVLIVGDSFAADWTKKHPNQLGWPNLLGVNYNVTNLAQAGASEYRILKQLETATIDEYDVVIVSHTSPYRIYTDYPVHNGDVLHQNCDLIYSDVENLALSDSDCLAVKTYFKKFFSLEYAEFCHKATISAIDKLLEGTKTLHLSHQTLLSPTFLDLSDVFTKHRGLINHYSDKGNHIVYNRILKGLS